MTTAKKRIEVALRGLNPRPPDSASSHVKKRYSEQMSEALALALAEALRARGMKGARPAPPGTVGPSGAERRMAGGIGAKKVDVTWATEESGLLLAISVKTINFKDGRSKNFQKNLTNRRSDMLIEAVTLHKRFPYAVVIALLTYPGGPDGADHDDTSRRSSTFINSHARLKLFTGRTEPTGRDEQYEKFFVCLHEATRFKASMDWYEAGDPTNTVDIDQALDEICQMIADRNPDLYEFKKGKMKRV